MSQSRGYFVSLAALQLFEEFGDEEELFTNYAQFTPESAIRNILQCQGEDLPHRYAASEEVGSGDSVLLGALSVSSCILNCDCSSRYLC